MENQQKHQNPPPPAYINQPTGQMALQTAPPQHLFSPAPMAMQTGFSQNMTPQSNFGSNAVHQGQGFPQNMANSNQNHFNLVPAITAQSKPGYGYDMAPGEFRFGLFSCFSNLGTCCCGFWPCSICCLYGRLGYRFFDNPEEARKKYKILMIIIILAVLTAIVPAIGGLFVLFFVIWLWVGIYIMHQNARREKGLPNGRFRDFLAVFFCVECVACRLANESGMDDICDCGQCQKLCSGQPIYHI